MKLWKLMNMSSGPLRSLHIKFSNNNNKIRECAPMALAI